jgi:aspartate/methionine/tyrosine aminotransferase
MKIKDFGVEIWMNLYENDCLYNLAETCVSSLTVNEVLDLSGEKEKVLHEIQHMKLTYGDIEGSVRLRKGIANLYEKQEIENISVLHGAIGANALTLMTLVDRGDQVVSVLPTYQQLYSIPESIGADVRILKLREENQFLPDLSELRNLVTEDTKLICINNPNNPTGALMDEAMLKKIVEIAREADAYILCDEVYRGLNHEGDSYSPSIADMYEKGISTGSMSKTYSMAGIRLGWACGPADFVSRLSKQRDYHVISCGMIDDKLATIALENKDKIIQRNLQIVRNNAKKLDQWVQNEPLISYVKPKGGTTAFLKYNLEMPSETLCKKLQKEKGVMLLPGAAMGMEGYLRIGFANESTIIEKGLSGFSDFLEEMQR